MVKCLSLFFRKILLLVSNCSQEWDYVLLYFSTKRTRVSRNYHVAQNRKQNVAFAHLWSVCVCICQNVLLSSLSSSAKMVLKMTHCRVQMAKIAQRAVIEDSCCAHWFDLPSLESVARPEACFHSQAKHFRWLVPEEGEQGNSLRK